MYLSDSTVYKSLLPSSLSGFLSVNILTPLHYFPISQRKRTEQGLSMAPTTTSQNLFQGPSYSGFQLTKISQLFLVIKKSFCTLI